MAGDERTSRSASDRPALTRTAAPRHSQPSAGARRRAAKSEALSPPPCNPPLSHPIVAHSVARGGGILLGCMRRTPATSSRWDRRASEGAAPWAVFGLPWPSTWPSQSLHRPGCAKTPHPARAPASSWDVAGIDAPSTPPTSRPSSSANSFELLLTFPGATLLSLDGDRVEPIRLEDTSHLQIKKGILEAPQRYSRHLLAEFDDDDGGGDPHNDDGARSPLETALSAQSVVVLPCVHDRRRPPKGCPERAYGLLGENSARSCLRTDLPFGLWRLFGDGSPVVRRAHRAMTAGAPVELS